MSDNPPPSEPVGDIPSLEELSKKYPHELVNGLTDIDVDRPQPIEVAEAVVAATEHDKTATTGEIYSVFDEEHEVSESTIRNRLDTLEEAELVEQSGSTSNVCMPTDKLLSSAVRSNPDTHSDVRSTTQERRQINDSRDLRSMLVVITAGTGAVVAGIMLGLTGIALETTKLEFIAATLFGGGIAVAFIGRVAGGVVLRYPAGRQLTTREFLEDYLTLVAR